LRLACLIKTKPVHFVSTNSVFSPSYAQGNLIQESDPLGINHGLNAGYTQSKWVAEKLIMEARKRGLPITIRQFKNEVHQCLMIIHRIPQKGFDSQDIFEDDD